MRIRIISKSSTAVLRPCCRGCRKYWQVCGVNFVIYLSAVYQIRGIKHETDSLRFVYLGLYACLLHNRIRVVFVSWGSRVSRQWARRGGKVVIPTHRPPLPPGNILVLISVTGLVDPRHMGLSVKHFSIIGNRIGDPLACSAVPQSTAPPRATLINDYNI
jgi:hypothetical protein